MLLAIAAGDRALAGDLHVERILALATAARGGDDDLRALGMVVLQPLVGALLCGDRYVDALELLDHAMAEVRVRGALAAHVGLLPLRGFLLLFAGRIADAVADAAWAVELADELPSVPRPALVAAHHVLAEAALERGDLAAAAAATSLPDPAVTDVRTPFLGSYLESVGRLALAGGRVDEAVEAYTAAAAVHTAAGGDGPVHDWRNGLARARRAGGDHGVAVDLAAEQLGRARHFGAARPLAAALRAVAAVSADLDEQITALDEAEGVVEGSEARLEQARVQVARGAALRRAGRRRQAREVLRAGLDAARTAGAAALARSAVEELEASGARQPRLAISGRDALTPSELRVARLAVEGRSNREIAETLYVTRKTVEVHLSATYRKLGIASRQELPDALG